MLAFLHSIRDLVMSYQIHVLSFTSCLLGSWQGAGYPSTNTPPAREKRNTSAQIVFQAPAASWVAQPLQGSLLDLANPFPCHAQLVAYLF
jgi:hypothetical protein